MTLPSSLPLTMGQIKGEFGSLTGNAPDLRAYYRAPGGPVPNTYCNRNIPTGGTIKISNFLGAKNASGGRTIVGIVGVGTCYCGNCGCQCCIYYGYNKNGLRAGGDMGNFSIVCGSFTTGTGLTAIYCYARASGPECAGIDR